MAAYQKQWRVSPGCTTSLAFGLHGCKVCVEPTYMRTPTLPASLPFPYLCDANADGNCAIRLMELLEGHAHDRPPHARPHDGLGAFRKSKYCRTCRPTRQRCIAHLRCRLPEIETTGTSSGGGSGPVTSGVASVMKECMSTIRTSRQGNEVADGRWDGPRISTHNNFQ